MRARRGIWIAGGVLVLAVGALILLILLTRRAPVQSAGVSVKVSGPTLDQGTPYRMLTVSNCTKREHTISAWIERETTPMSWQREGRTYTTLTLDGLASMDLIPVLSTSQTGAIRLTVLYGPVPQRFERMLRDVQALAGVKPDPPAKCIFHWNERMGLQKLSAMQPARAVSNIRRSRSASSSDSLFTG